MKFNLSCSIPRSWHICFVKHVVSFVSLPIDRENHAERSFKWICVKAVQSTCWYVVVSWWTVCDVLQLRHDLFLDVLLLHHEVSLDVFYLHQKLFLDTLCKRSYFINFFNASIDGLLKFSIFVKTRNTRVNCAFCYLSWVWCISSFYINFWNRFGKVGTYECDVRNRAEMLFKYSFSKHNCNLISRCGI